MIQEIQKEIMSLKSKSCELDTISAELLKEILPYITHIINISLPKELFANDWKTTIVHTLLKRPGLDLLMKNYRPVSNLCFLSKLVECCMLKQLISHCNTNNLTSNQHTGKTTVQRLVSLKCPVTYSG